MHLLAICNPYATRIFSYDPSFEGGMVWYLSAPAVPRSLGRTAPVLALHSAWLGWSKVTLQAPVAGADLQCCDGSYGRVVLQMIHLVWAQSVSKGV